MQLGLTVIVEWYQRNGTQYPSDNEKYKTLLASIMESAVDTHKHYAFAMAYIGFENNTLWGVQHDPVKDRLLVIQAEDTHDCGYTPQKPGIGASTQRES